MPLCWVANYNTSQSALLLKDASHVAAIDLSPSDGTYLYGRVLDNLVSSFERYRVTRLAFEYVPTSVLTNVEDGYVFAFTDDPFNPVTAAPTVDKLMLLSDSIVFPSFQPWRMNASVSGDWRYVYASGVGAADARLAFMGVIMCMRTNTAGNSNTRGALYIDAHFECKDINPVDTTTAPAVEVKARVKATDKGAKSLKDMPIYTDFPDTEGNIPVADASGVTFSASTAPFTNGTVQVAIDAESGTPQVGDGTYWMAKGRPVVAAQHPLGKPYVRELPSSANIKDGQLYWVNPNVTVKAVTPDSYGNVQLPDVAYATAKTKDESKADSAKSVVGVEEAGATGVKPCGLSSNVKPSR